MSYENFIFHREQNSIARAQKNYDAQMPEEVWDCKEQGHKWKRIPGEIKDDVRFARCIKCGLEAEV